MSILRKENKRAISESDRPITNSQKDTSNRSSNRLSRRKFLTLFGAGVIATSLFGAKALAGEPEKQVQVASATVNTNTKAGTPGETQSSNYTLTVNSTNVFIGEAVLISLVDSMGNLAKGSKVDVTDPSGNTFKISIDNLQNGFVARTAGDYLVEYGNTKLVVTVKEMDAELASLDTVSSNEVKSLVEKTEHLFTYAIEENNLSIFNAQGDHLVTTDISRFKKLKLSLDGLSLENLRIGSETGKNSTYGGEYLQVLIVATSESISNNILMQTLVLGSDSKKVYGPEIYLLK